MLSEQLAELQQAASAGADGGTLAEVKSQLAALKALGQSIATASGSSLAQLRSEVSASVAKSQNVAQEARAQLGAANAAELSKAVNDAANASRVALHDAMDGLRHVPLKFASPEDEAEYRQREDERRAYIEAQQAKHTPEGDLNYRCIRQHPLTFGYKLRLTKVHSSMRQS
jgi:hypothetical protein